MSNIDEITAEIAKIQAMCEGDYEEPSVELDEDNRPSLEDFVTIVAGVVMESFPPTGEASSFGAALVEAAFGASEDCENLYSAEEILEGLRDFYTSAFVVAEASFEQANMIEDSEEEADKEAEEYRELDDPYDEDDEDDEEDEDLL